LPLSARLLLLLALAGAVPLGASPLWTLSWADEGDGAANSLPDSAKWRMEQGGGGWGNSELQTYTNRSQNARYDGAGNLVLEARQEGYTGPDGIYRNYTSARLLTSATFTQAYGRFEARLQTTVGQGLWPAFWMLGNNIGSVGWPACGEIDIMENVGYEPTITHGTVHGPGYSGGNGIGLAYNAGVPLGAAFHVYAVEWEPNIIRWYFDNVLYETRTPADLPGGAAWVYDHPHFMLLNIAVGGNWPGSPDAGTVFPQRMTVDYVRVYSRNTARRPYNAALPIPGTIQAAEFDDGGEGVSYHDSTVLNLGGAARTSDPVDLEACTGDGGGYNVGYTAAGEYLKYTVNVAAAGTYDLRVRVAGQDPGGSFHFTLDGAALANSAFSVPNSGGWQTWTTLGPQTVTLPAGQHDLGLVFDSNGSGGGCGNLHWFSFTQLALATATPGNTAVPSPTRTATPTRTPSRSATRSSTPSLSATPSLSPTLTATRSASPSPSPSATPSHTPTPSPTGTASPTLSATPSATPVESPTLTRSPEPGSPTSSPSVTRSATPTCTQSPQAPTASSTLSSTPSLSPTRTASPTASSTPTLSPTRTASPSATPTSSPEPGSPSPTATLSPQPTGQATVQAGEHERVWLASNPQTGRDLQVVVESLAGLKDARLKVYSAAMVLVVDEPLGPLGPGWHRRQVPGENLPNGMYWVKLSEGKRLLGPASRMLVLR
jgi:beta-glucanase (GH16 family)